ncbi:universal stress protein [Actinotalea sp. M2MS4P-6]|uniref:universal stress protein n=1 Tax=Actinotalea sp. M2MS4P-6 TaxID=2983762 RepID=UPI0021E4F270|nr:universal stress protein [Actinotalea sp. M2MS4P-6]MCV2393572.1 universal stress protein [Actinotalea sp. M2MS4P-6]
MNADRPPSVMLVAVNDSEAAFAAAEVAVSWAAVLGARVHVLTVIEPWERAHHAYATDEVSHREVQQQAAHAALHHVTALGEGAGVPVTGAVRHGAVGSQVLAEAAACGADLVVMARVSRPGHAMPTVGSATLRVLEFATVPVLVVPTEVPPGRPHLPA